MRDHDINPSKAAASDPPAGELEYSVVLPCTPSAFKDFISSLLGKPQTSEKHFHGSFDFSRTDVENTFHLVDQRVGQQNEASLIQFSVRIVYDDDSSVLINTLDDFLRYAEVRPLVSVAVHLTWIYLIRFQDRHTPERQQIDMSVIADNAALLVHVEENVHLVRRQSLSGAASHIFIRINHTARTWGADIEALLTGHVKTLLRTESWL